jgi:hypothetical protein
MPNTTAPPSASPASRSRQLSPLEAEVYFATTLEVWQTKDQKDEPSLDEYRDLAQVVDRLARLKDASEQHRELQEPFVLVWLQHKLLCLAEEKHRQEVAVPDESDAARHTKELIVACEGLIERAKAYEPVTCWWCGAAPATLRDTTARSQPASEDAWCERCARHEFAKRLGEAFVLSEAVQAVIEFLRKDFTDEEVRRALDGALEERNVLFGAARAEYDWVKSHDDDHTRVYGCYLSQFEPLDAAAVEVPA